MKRVILLIGLLLLTLTATPCTDIGIPNCILVDINNTWRSPNSCYCITCSAGLIKSSNHLSCCLSEISYCRQCQNLTCVTCSKEYGFARNTSLCQNCFSIIPRCFFCDYTDNCTECMEGYGFINSTTECSLCSAQFPNCQTCFSYADGCTSCQPRYALTNKTKCMLCYLFMPYCSQCYSSTTTCRGCNSSLYVLNASTNPNICQLCNVSLSNCVNSNSLIQCTSCVNRTYGLYYSDNWRFRYTQCRLCRDFLTGCYNCQNLDICLSCVNNSYTLNKNTKKCDKCSVGMPYCNTCNVSYFCLSCMDQRYALVYLLNLTYMMVCQPCDNLMKGCLYCSSAGTCTKCLQGRATGGGCTSVIGCDYVNSTISAEANCLSCDPLSFYLTPVNGSLCICLDGWIVGDYCTTIIGCTGLTIRNYAKVCVNCNFSGHFELSNDTCVCKKYYFFNEQICQQICGDGHRIYLSCDDGNLINGDGCSSSCQLQPNFVCKNDPSAFPATNCQFKGKVGLSLEGIYKVAGKNQVQIVFSISPYSDVMLKMNLTQGVSSNLSSSYIASEQLVLTADYFRNIEGETAKILVEFDSDYVRSPNFNLLFSMVESTGLTLSYDQSPTSSSEMLGAAAKIIGYVLIAVFALGSVCYKMIGVETVQSVQIVLNLQAASLYYKTLFSNFKGLSIAYGQVSSFIPSSQPIKQSFYVNLGYQFDINHNYAVLGILNVGFITVYVVLKTASYWYTCRLQQLKAERDEVDNKLTSEQQKANLKAAQKCQAKESKIRRVSGLVYNCLLFPFLVGFYFQLFNVIMISQSSSDGARQSSYNIFAISFTYMGTALVFFQEFLSLFTKSGSAQALLKPDKHRYVPIYLLFTVGTFALTHALSSGMINAFFGFLAVGGLCCCYLVFLLVYRPYSAAIHLVSLVYNQLTIILSVGWIISKSQAFYNSKFQTALMYGFIAALSILLLLAIARLAFAFRQVYFTTKPAQKEKISQSKKAALRNRRSLSM